MLHRSVQFKTQSVAEDGAFEGYASAFGAKEPGGDVVAPGAFAGGVRVGGRGYRALRPLC